jgi:hypothetical protein
MILQFLQISGHFEGIPDSLATGLANPTTVMTQIGLEYDSSSPFTTISYITGVMYQVCGIFSVGSLKLKLSYLT